MYTDYYAHYYMNNENAQEEIEDEDFDMDAELARIEAEAEGATIEDDPDDWEPLV